MAEQIGFIGLGVMGRPMAKHLVAKGHRVVVHSRSRAPVDDLVAAGATAAPSSAEVARQSAIVITMLPDTSDVELALTAPDGVIAGLQRDAVVIDMSSISPVATRRLASLVAAKGGTMLDAPVSGGEIGAINASLSIMVGGDGQAFARARKAGVDAGRVRQALLGGFAASRVLEVHGERMLKSDYKPGFRTKLYQKDLRIASETAAANAVAIPATAIVTQLVNALVAAGGADLDYSAIGTVLFKLAGTL